MATITNVVVLMLENRSYDNVLGALYMNAAPPPGQWSLNGLTGNESNPDPGGGPPIPVHSTSSPVQLGGTGPAYPPTCLPLVDPGEPFNDMAQQFLSLDAPPTSEPYANYIPTGYVPPNPGLMQGFTDNYNLQLSSAQSGNVQDIMNYLTPEQLPVTTFLAQNYGVCDEWFASAPTHTFTNRTFAVLAAPAVEQPVTLFERKPDGPPFSYIDDPQWATLVGVRVPSTSIFEQLDNVYPDGMGSATAPNWRIYFHDYPINLLVDPYAYGIATSSANENVCAFDTTDYNGNVPSFLGQLPAATFVSDVQNGLPMFSFIEPRYNMHTNLLNGNPGDLLPNCDHPGLGNIPFGFPSSSSTALNVPIDAASGELLLMQVYNLVQASPNWATTLFVVTFDEPGGTYDHVAPPLATPPGSQFPAAQDPRGDPAANNFNFNVFGGRVPAIVISPLIAQGSTIRATAPFDHTSIIATVWEAFGLTQGSTTSLTDRDAAAPSLMPFLTASNTTPSYSAAIVCAPSALVFLGSSTVMFFASAGTTELSASMSDQPSWVTTFTPTWSPSTNILTVVVGVDASGVTALQTATFQVTGQDLASVTVNVTLDPT